MGIKYAMEQSMAEEKTKSQVDEEEELQRAINESLNMPPSHPSTWIPPSPSPDENGNVDQNGNPLKQQPKQKGHTRHLSSEGQGDGGGHRLSESFFSSPEFSENNGGKNGENKAGRPQQAGKSVNGKPGIYKLVAIVTHQGWDPQAGHYIADALDHLVQCMGAQKRERECTGL